MRGGEGGKRGGVSEGGREHCVHKLVMYTKREERKSGREQNRVYIGCHFSRHACNR